MSVALRIGDLCCLQVTRHTDVDWARNADDHRSQRLDRMEQQETTDGFPIEHGDRVSGISFCYMQSHMAQANIEGPAHGGVQSEDDLL